MPGNIPILVPAGLNGGSPAAKTGLPPVKLGVIPKGYKAHISMPGAPPSTAQITIGSVEELNSPSASLPANVFGGLPITQPQTPIEIYYTGEMWAIRSDNVPAALLISFGIVPQ
jgi:hypothetical protein